MDIEVTGLEKFGRGLKIQQSDKSIEKQNEEFFYSIIERLSIAFENSNALIELGIDTTSYENNFYNIIEDLMFLHYGHTKSEIMLWWVYELPNLEKKTPIFLIDGKGNKTQIKNIKQLYKYLQKIEK
jgi:hypothetical protein